MELEMWVETRDLSVVVGGDQRPETRDQGRH